MTQKIQREIQKKTKKESQKKTQKENSKKTPNEIQKDQNVNPSEFSEWYLRILEDAEIIDTRFPIKGMPVYRGWAVFIIRKMQKYLEELLEESGHEPTLFPVLIPEDILGKEKDHIAGFEEEVFWVTHAGANELDRRMALRPTSETSMYEMFGIWIRSHTDLPLKIHQSCTVYRYDTKHTRPLIRGREFLWNEGHSAHVDWADAKKNLAEIEEIYGKLINQLLCLPFAINIRPEWDKFPGATNTYAFDTIMPDGRTLQIATSHDLGQNFSRVFEITFENEEGGHDYIYQTSYGPGFGRLLAAAISIHGDEKGLVLPPAIAPIQVVIIPILFKKSDNAAILEYAANIEKILKRNGIRTRIDAGEGHPGAKFYHWEMKGVPLRLEVGPRDFEANSMIVVRRDTREKLQVGFDELSSKNTDKIPDENINEIPNKNINENKIRTNTNKIHKILDEISLNLRKTAEKKFTGRFFEAKTMDDIEKYTGQGIIVSGWCGEKECADAIEMHGSILNVSEGIGEGGVIKPDKIHRICPACGGSGMEIRVARTY